MNHQMGFFNESLALIKLQGMYHIDLSDINLTSTRAVSRNEQEINTSRGACTSRNLLKIQAFKPAVLEQCLKSLDIFNKIIEQSQKQKRQIVRDVLKVLKIQTKQPGDIIYNYGDKALNIFLILEGNVSTFIRTKNQRKLEKQGQDSIIQQQISNLDEGCGFGASEFITKKLRETKRVAGDKGCTLGLIERSSFQEVIENYKLRVYYVKRDIFQKCPLFSQMEQNKLEFIVNNTKLVQYKRGQQIIKEQSQPKFLILLMKGSIKLKKELTNPQKKILPSIRQHAYSKYHSCLKLEKGSKLDQVTIGLVQSQEFIGDAQYCLQKKFHYSAHCESLTAQIYLCDYRIIKSQLSHEVVQNCQAYYLEKEQHYLNRLDMYEHLKKIVTDKHERAILEPLTSLQMQKRKKILRKYTQDNPSIIGGSSVKQISLLIQRKRKLLKPLSKSTINTINKTFETKHDLISDQFTFSRSLTTDLISSLEHSQDKDAKSLKKLKMSKMKKRKVLNDHEASNKIDNIKKIMQPHSCSIDFKQINAAINKIKNRYATEQ